MHKNIIDLQRAVAFNQMGKDARQLLAEARKAPSEWEAKQIRQDADRILDAMNERLAEWRQETDIEVDNNSSIE